MTKTVAADTLSAGDAGSAVVFRAADRFRRAKKTKYFDGVFLRRAAVELRRSDRF